MLQYYLMNIKAIFWYLVLAVKNLYMSLCYYCFTCYNLNIWDCFKSSIPLSETVFSHMVPYSWS